MMRWWMITGLCVVLGCSGVQQDDIGSVQQAVYCSRDLPPTGDESEGQSWHWGGGAEYPDIVEPNDDECTGAIYELPDEDFPLDEDGWPDTEEELRFALGALASPTETRRVIFLLGITDIAIDPEADGPLVIPSNTWLASLRGRPTIPATSPPPPDEFRVPNKGALIRSTRRDTDVPLIRVDGEDVRITGLRIWGPEPELCPSEWDVTPKGSACTYRHLCSEVCIMDDGDTLDRTCLIADPEGPGLIRGSCIADGYCFNEAGTQMFDCVADPGAPCATYSKCTDDVAKDGCTYCTRPTVGILANGSDWSVATAQDLEVDNCDIAGFAQAGIYIEGAVGAKIHHNYIHHSQRPGNGYPIEIGGYKDHPTVEGEVLYFLAEAQISHNRFQDYRHAVASTGGPNQHYTADRNLALGKTIGRVFDVHEVREDGHECNCNDSGGLTIVSNNRIFPDNFFSFDVRGIPAIDAFFYGNRTARSDSWPVPNQVVPCGGNPWPGDDSSSDEAVCQRDGSGDNVTIGETQSGAPAANQYDQSPDELATLRWCISSRGIRPYEYMASSEYGIDVLRYGDFDGDSRTDVFLRGDGRWLVSYGGVGFWHEVQIDDTPLSNLMFGDFNDDGRTDVFRRHVTDVFPEVIWEWQYFPGQAEPPNETETWQGSWQTLVENAGDIPVSQLAVGRFDATDTTNDIFHASGTVWRYRPNGSGSWVTLRTTSTPMSDLAVGNFNLDAITDVFWADGGAWRYYPGGTGSAVMLDNDNNIEVYKLKFGDLGGNSRTDVFYANGLRWRYKLAGIGEWIQLALAAENYDEVVLGYFDDDPPLDVFFPDCH